MPKYRINPPGVATVLKATGHEAQKFDADLKPMGGYVGSAVSGCGGSAVISGALATFFEIEGSRLKDMGTQVNACLSGAAVATAAYTHADLDMMRTAQTNASEAKITTMPARYTRR